MQKSFIPTSTVSQASISSLCQVVEEQFQNSFTRQTPSALCLHTALDLPAGKLLELKSSNLTLSGYENFIILIVAFIFLSRVI